MVFDLQMSRPRFGMAVKFEPIFNSKETTQPAAIQPYEQERAELEKLSAQGPAVGPKVAEILKKAIAEKPKTPELEMKEFTQDKDKPQNRQKLIQKGYAALRELVKAAAAEGDVKVRHACWLAAASVIQANPHPIGYTTDLARALLEAIASGGDLSDPSTRPPMPRPTTLNSRQAEDLALLKTLVLQPEFLAAASQGPSLLVNRLPPREHRNWVLEQLKKVAEKPDADPVLTETLVRVTPGGLDFEALEVAWALAKSVKDPEVRSAAVEFIARGGISVESARKWIIAVMQPIVLSPQWAAEDNAHLPAVWFMGKCGDVEMLKRLFPLLSDPNPEVRRQAAGGICEAMDWLQINPHYVQDSEHKKMQAEAKTKDRITRLLAIIERKDENQPLPFKAADPAEQGWLKLAETANKQNGEFSLDKLLDAAAKADLNPQEVIAILHAALYVADERCLKVVEEILAATNNRQIRNACIRVFMNAANSIGSFREATRSSLHPVMEVGEPETRRLAIMALANTGYLPNIISIAPLLTDKDIQVRRAAAVAVCSLIGWPQVSSTAPKQEIENWIKWIEDQSEELMKAIALEPK